MHRWPLVLIGGSLIAVVAVAANAQPPSPIESSELATSGAVQDSAAQDSATGTATPPAAVDPDPAPPNPAEIAQWIQDLDGDAFATRVRATKQLVRAGASAIEPLTRELPNFDREAATRGVYVLRQLTLESKDPTIRQSAAAALETLAEGKAPTASRAAISTLQSVFELWDQQAQVQLRQAGAVIANTPIVTQRNAQQIFRSISFGSPWHGEVADLAKIAHVTDRRYREAGAPWMIIFDGAQVTDEWFESIAKTPGIAVVRCSSTRITNAGLQRILELPDLQAVELLYNDIDDQSLESLAAHPNLTRLRLVGNRISYDGADRLRQMMARAEIDFRAGGFLGVACTDNPCRINHVQDNTAAARAGFRINDVIVSYNGQAVNSMDELIRAIAQHGVGEKVSVEVERDGNRFTRELVLGKWD